MSCPWHGDQTVSANETANRSVYLRQVDFCLVAGKELAVGLESGLVRVFNMALPYPSSTIVWRSISQGISISSLNWNDFDSVASKEKLASVCYSEQ
jgi:hypothetical protein